MLSLNHVAVQDSRVPWSSGIQFGTLWPLTHSPNLPDRPSSECSQRASVSPPSSPLVPLRAGFHTIDPMPRSSSLSGGRCNRKNGMLDECTRSRVSLENCDSEINKATAGELILWSTPSISRMYLGPIFFCSALHCPKTRIRLLSADPGSHHQPCKSIPPSDRPPTRRSDMDRLHCRRLRARFSKAQPL